MNIPFTVACVSVVSAIDSKSWKTLVQSVLSKCACFVTVDVVRLCLDSSAYIFVAELWMDCIAGFSESSYVGTTPIVEACRNSANFSTISFLLVESGGDI